jgi:chromosome segregation ATPase
LGVVVMGEERIVAEIPEELKRLVDTDERTNKEVVEAALWREFGGQRKGALERRIEEKERRISMLEGERNEREREIEDEQKELRALKSKKEMVESESAAERENVIERAAMIPADPSHPFVQEHADELDMTADELAEAIADAHGKDLQTDTDDDLNSL